MKQFFILLFLSCVLSAKPSTQNRIECTPNKVAYASPDSDKAEKLEGKAIEQNKLIIKKVGNVYEVETRGNKELQYSISGIYDIYYSDSVTVKIETTTKQYFEFVSMGLGTITYFGKCK